MVFGLLNPLAATSSGSGNFLGLLIPLMLMGAVFYFLLIRPQRRRQQAQRSLIDSVSVGDEVMTIGGIYGTVREIDDESVVLEVADNVDVRFVRSAIARRLVYDEDADEPDARDESEEAEEEAGEQS
jgi:preprotein translocase subunit YajC